MNSNFCCLLVCFSLSIPTIANRASALVTVPTSVRTVALSGSPAPDTQSGVTFQGFGTPVLDASGQATFRAELLGTGAGLTNNSGIWSERSGTLSLLARSGNSAPGTADTISFASFDNPGLNSAGQAAFLAELTGTGVNDTNNEGIWTEGSGPLSLLARTGDAAPGSGAGVVFEDLLAPLINTQGRTAFSARLNGPGTEPLLNNTGFWSDRTGQLEKIVIAGESAPGTSKSTTFASINTRAFSSVGRAAFRARILDDFGATVVPGIDDVGIWSEGSGTLELLARRGDQAAGAASGVQYFQLAAESINASGSTAFTGRTLDNLGGGEGRGIWSDRSGQVEAVALTGGPAGGLPSGVTYNNLANPAMHSSGKVSFNGTVQGPGVDATNQQAIWVDDAGMTRLVARTGDPAPDAPTGENFDRMFLHQLNAAGQILIGASVEENHGFNNGLWAEDRSGTLRLIVIEGAVFEVAPGDNRTVSNISSSCILRR